MAGKIATMNPLTAGLALVVLLTVYGWLFLHAESEMEVLVLLVVAAVAVFAAARTGFFRLVSRAQDEHHGTMNGAMIVGVLVLIGLFSQDHFPLLMLTTVLLYMTVALGLNIQFGYAGMVNFAGAAFFGTGAYTAAVLGTQTAVPGLLVIAIGGLIAALIGSILILPVVRTRGHYSAVVTIAFSVLFKTFLEVNDTLGGPQGLMVESMKLFGWDFNNSPTLFGVEMSFYVNYALLALALTVLAFTFTRRLERSWIGLTLDSVRLDETSSACFGIGIVRAKILAFTAGNVLAGMAGALYGMMMSFIAPTSFTFSDSLILVAIVLLGGMGSLWGAALAATVVVVLPEKFQIIQEYRFLLFSVLVMGILLFRPDGLLPRGVRSYIPGWRPQA